MLHLWVAERFCEICGITNHDIVQKIIVGTEFPDIRYLTHTPRDLTHPVILTIQEVCQSMTPFEIGMRLHAWLDITRENFIVPEVYDAIAPYAEGSSATLLKLIEEEILADFYDGRRWSFCLDQALPEELAFASEAVVLKWHEMIQWTMSVRFSWLLWAQSYWGPAFSLSTNTLYNWSYLLPKLKQEAIFQRHFHDLLDFLDAEMRTGIQASELSL